MHDIGLRLTRPSNLLHGERNAMRPFKPTDLAAVKEAFKNFEGLAWQSVHVEYHEEYDEVPVFILMFSDFEIEETRRAAIQCVEWFNSRFTSIQLTIAFHLIKNDEKTILAYIEDKNIAEGLRSMRFRFSDVFSVTSSGTVFGKKTSKPKVRTH